MGVGRVSLYKNALYLVVLPNQKETFSYQVSYIKNLLKLMVLKIIQKTKT